MIKRNERRSRHVALDGGSSFYRHRYQYFASRILFRSSMNNFILKLRYPHCTKISRLLVELSDINTKTTNSKYLNNF